MGKHKHNKEVKLFAVTPTGPTGPTGPSGGGATGSTGPAGPASSPSSARATRATAQKSILTSTDTAVIFDATAYDTGPYWSNSNPTRLTAPSTGVYEIGAQIQWLGGIDGFAQPIIVPSGTQVYAMIRTSLGFIASKVSGRFFDNDSNEVVLLETTTEFRLLAGQYVELIVSHNSGATIDVSSNNHSPVFWIEKVS